MGLMVACLEEIAFQFGWITATEVAEVAKYLEKNDYGRYLLRVLQQKSTAQDGIRERSSRQQMATG